jgi:GTP 3',8-cyclase
MPVTDQLARPLRDLRVSVTDRCNFRCTYCMPRDVFGPDHAFVQRAELLTFEETTRLVALFARLGVRKVRLTGGEPLVRRDLERLIGLIAGVEGIEDLALTTNGSLLAAKARVLRDAGLRRVTVSLDALDPAVFRAFADTPVPVGHVLEGLAAARDAGFDPVKVNCVVKRGVNEDEIVPLAAFGRDHGYIVRFIELMDVGTTNGWRLDDVVPAAEIVQRLDAAFGVEPIDRDYAGEVAERYRYRDGGGEVGVISSITRPFCATCTRARLSAIGELYTCLFAAGGTDLRALLRGGASDDDLLAAITAIWQRRTDRYSELRTAETADLPRVEMSYIGG